MSNIVFHYCSVEKFKEIVNSKMFWLCDLTKSNDTQEVSRTFRILWDNVKERLRKSDLDSDIVEQEIEVIDKQFILEMQLDNPYGTCFCRDADLLQQWQEYGDNTKGISLGFDMDWFDNLKHQRPHPSANQSQALGYAEVLYHSPQLEKKIYDVCYEGIKEHGLSGWIMVIRPTFKHYSAFIKNPTFFGEKEVRIVYYPNKYNGHKTNEAMVSAKVDAPITHYCLPWADNHGHSALKLIVRGCNCDLEISDIEKILINGGLSGKFDAFDSACSYRIR